MDAMQGLPAAQSDHFFRGTPGSDRRGAVDLADAAVPVDENHHDGRVGVDGREFLFPLAQVCFALSGNVENQRISFFGSEK
jgi:hypothetical protein